MAAERRTKSTAKSLQPPRRPRKETWLADQAPTAAEDVVIGRDLRPIYCAPSPSSLVMKRKTGKT
jgi:hypothetical protein